MEMSTKNLSFISKSPNISIQESVRLLDNSVRSRPRSIFRISNSTPIQRRTNVRNRDSFGVSASDILAKSLHDYKLAETSITLAPDEISKYLPHASASAILQGQEQCKNVTDRLFMEFLISLQTHGSEQQVFEIIEDYIQTCTDTLDLLKSMEFKSMGAKSDFLLEETWLENERNTWRLVFCLFRNRLSVRLASVDDDGKMGDDLMDLGFGVESEKDRVQDMYKRDNITREYQLVIDWLEQNASDAEENDARLQHFTDKTVTWENTLHQLQSKSEIIPYLSRRPIVTKIDPDAPLRENKPLHDIDMEDEARLVREVFIRIRCGKLEDAQLLCVHTGQEWRAAALEGWRLFHDPNYNLQKGLNLEEKMPVEGNPNRDIWKLMAWQMADDKRVSIYERATFAALSGHLLALTTVCKTWEDFLWAYLRVLIDIRVEKEIRTSSIKHYIELPDAYWSNEMEIEHVFSELAAKKDVYMQQESDLLHRVQQFLIMDQVGILMEEMERWLRIHITELSSQKLRFLAHLILFLRLIGRAEKDHIGDAILQAYVKQLMAMREPQLVAHYVATLPQEEQITLYAEFLADITETAERELALAAAEEADLDIQTITKVVVENIRNKESSDEVTSLQAEITKEDLMKVSALDWVVHYPSQRAEAMWQANAIVRHFLAVSKLDAARMAYNKIPADSIDLVLKQYHSSAETSINLETMSIMQNVPFLVSSSIREFLCYKAYLDAEEGFSDWFQHYHHAKPVAPKIPAGDVPFTEKVAFEHRSNQYKSELERWKMAMMQQTKTVKAQLYNVLTFPEGGWLVDSDADDDIDLDEEMSRRQKQMADLRQLCIPKVVLLLHTVMHEMEEYAECVALADLISSRQHKLFKVFTKKRLGDVLEKICLSSLALTSQKRDPWGCPVSS